VINEFKKLNEVERELWVDFHNFAYKDDLNLSKLLIESHPRWSIISGYYAMHNIAKLYLGKLHNIKISGINVHEQVIEALKYTLKNNSNAEQALNLLKKAEDKINELGVDDIPYLLKSGKKERSKVQYYSKESFSNNKEYVNKAKEFFEEVNIFIKIMETMINVS